MPRKLEPYEVEVTYTVDHKLGTTRIEIRFGDQINDRACVKVVESSLRPATHALSNRCFTAGRYAHTRPIGNYPLMLAALRARKSILGIKKLSIYEIDIPK